jgi:nicotinate-nucleotide--dimethylbenzimidazole phosphoribosyltransferase
MSLIEEAINKIGSVDGEAARTEARARLGQLTMPYWALGRLMDLAEDLAWMTGQMPPRIARKVVVVMAGDHGVTRQGTSRYPREVTGQMIHNFASGGAGINALARQAGARVVVVDMGVDADLSVLERQGKIISKKIEFGTADVTTGPAMSHANAVRSIEAGIEVAWDLAPTTDLFGTGDMGIGNTTVSSAVTAVLCGAEVESVTGRGTGIDDEQLQKKICAIEKALSVNEPDPGDGLDVLAKVGGFEIGGIAGLILGAAAERKPVLIDGFISTAGALIAARIAPASRKFMISAHRSTEPGHGIALENLGLTPRLDLDMRLGEGTGCALAMNIVDAAVRVLTEVATFEEASVSRAD